MANVELYKKQCDHEGEHICGAPDHYHVNGYPSGCPKCDPNFAERVQMERIIEEDFQANIAWRLEDEAAAYNDSPEPEEW